MGDQLVLQKLYCPLGSAQRMDLGLDLQTAKIISDELCLNTVLGGDERTSITLSPLRAIGRCEQY